MYSKRKTHAKLDTPRDIRTIVNIQYTRREFWTCAAAENWTGKERDESVLFEHYFTTLPLITTTDHRPSLNHQLTDSPLPPTLKGLRHIALSLVSGDVVRADDGQPRRRQNPETACQQWSDRIKTHCASSPAHVRTKRLQHYYYYPWRTTPWSRYRYALWICLRSDSDLCDSLVPV